MSKFDEFRKYFFEDKVPSNLVEMPVDLSFLGPWNIPPEAKFDQQHVSMLLTKEGELTTCDYRKSVMAEIILHNLFVQGIMLTPEIWKKIFEWFDRDDSFFNDRTKAAGQVIFEMLVVFSKTNADQLYDIRVKNQREGADERAVERSNTFENEMIRPLIANIFDGPFPFEIDPEPPAGSQGLRGALSTKELKAFLCLDAVVDAIVTTTNDRLGLTGSDGELTTKATKNYVSNMRVYIYDNLADLYGITVRDGTLC